jgi:energy-coupling factor transporter ATP-binding protein EcfA2
MIIPNLTINDFSHYLHAVKEVKIALSSENSILINGHSGCGKSTLITLLLNETKHEILEVNSSNYESLSTMKARFLCFSKTKTIAFFTQQQPKIIFVDDLDVLMSIDKKFLGFLIDFIKSNQCKVICINNTSMNKKTLDTKGSFKVIVNLKRLTYKQCFQITVMNIPEHMEIDYDKLTLLIKENNNDLRTVLNHLYDIKINSNVINLRKKPKFLEMTIEEIILQMCYHSLTDQEINEIVTHDINQIICLLHENINKWFSTTSICRKEMEFVRLFNEIVINSEYIGKYIFDKYDFAIWDHYTFDKIKSINHLLFNHFALINNPVPVNKLDHSQLINKQSLALNFNKKLVKMEKDLCVYKLDCSSILMYIHSLIYSKTNKFDILQIVTKNEFEILTRYLSDFSPDSKQQLLKLKNSMLK